MSIQVIERQPSKGQQIALGISRGLSNRRTNQTAAQEKPLANMKTMAELQKLQMEAQSYAQPLPSGTAGQDPFIRLPGNKIVKNPSYVNLPMANAKLDQDLKKQELMEMTKLLPKLDQAGQSVGQLKELYYKGVSPIDVQPGDAQAAFKARYAGLPRSAAALIGLNPSLRQYQKQRQGFSGLIAKGGFGEAGMLTNQDIQRIASMLPTESSTKAEAELAFTEVSKILQSARQRYEAKRNQYVSGSLPENDNSDPLGVF